MKERPILFSGAMVRAILKGRKTQTRRIINPQPSLGDGGCWYPEPPRQPAHRARHYANEYHLRKGLAIDFCSYGQPGDRLWVQEAHAFTWRNEEGDEVSVRYTADGAERRVLLTTEEAEKLDARTSPLTRQQPGRFLYRSCSRLTLEVTDVRVQRLQEISEEDARGEGVERSNDDRWPWRNYDPLDGAPFVRASTSFCSLWNSINGKRPGCSWESNPWVWCVSFRRAP